MTLASDPVRVVKVLGGLVPRALPSLKISIPFGDCANSCHLRLVSGLQRYKMVAIGHRLTDKRYDPKSLEQGCRLASSDPERVGYLGSG